MAWGFRCETKQACLVLLLNSIFLPTLYDCFVVERAARVECVRLHRTARTLTHPIFSRVAGLTQLSTLRFVCSWKRHSSRS